MLSFDFIKKKHQPQFFILMQAKRPTVKIVKQLIKFQDHENFI